MSIIIAIFIVINIVLIRKTCIWLV
jgi:hypothetical protein